MADQYLERVIDLTDPASNRIHNMTIEDARARVAAGAPERVSEIDGSFALVARDGRRVRLARSLDRPMRYFLAKQAAGPALVVSDRIDAIRAFLDGEGLAGQFHPSYTRMVPAHYVVEIELVGCPDPSPTYARYFTPDLGTLPADPAAIGLLYVGALADEIAKWLAQIPAREPVGVCFSGGVDSGAVFLVTYHLLRRLGLDPGLLKAFTLSLGRGEDLAQARAFLEPLGLGMFLEAVEAAPETLDPLEAVRVVEDYKPLDVESATMALALFRGIRERYPSWRYLLDGDGGDENLKDYPIEENPELTIRSVVNNPAPLPGGLGCRAHEALSDLLGRAEPLILPHVCAAAAARVRGIQPLHAPPRHRDRRGDPVRHPDGRRHGAALRDQGRHRVARRRSRHRDGDARLPQAPLPARSARPEEAARRLSLGEADYRSHFLSLYA